MISDIKIIKLLIANHAEINALKKAMEGKVVLAKRDPCLHRHSVRGMYMKLVDDETFHIHPIICGPYNADKRHCLL